MPRKLIKAKAPKRKGRKPIYRRDAKVADLVQLLASCGDLVTQAVAAKAAKLTVKTFLRYYEADWRMGRGLALAKVAHALYSTALDRGTPGAVTAAIFYLKTHGGKDWLEPPTRLQGTEDGPPIRIESLSDAQLGILLKRLKS